MRHAAGVPLAYRLGARIAAPLYCGVLAWRGFTERGYWRNFGERLGLGAPLAPHGVWVHCASVGEVQAAAQLLRTLRARLAGPMLLTTVTPAGAARARALFAGQALEVRHLPLDLPGPVRRFLDRIRPRLALILETELWPRLYAECAERGIALVLANARISERSARRYALLRGAFAGALERCALIAAQSEADGARLAALGAAPARTHVTGNLKFDLAPPRESLARASALTAEVLGARSLWVGGSTHEGEEIALLEAHAKARTASADLLLALAPRHPQRFEAVARLLASRGVAFVRRSRAERCESATQVLLIDTLGELTDFYAAADVVFVGGSLVRAGGHNLIEPAALGRAILTGPHHENARDVLERLTAAGAVRIVADAAELGAQLAALLADPLARARMGQAGLGVVEHNRGALERLLQLLAPYLSPVLKAAE